MTCYKVWYKHLYTYIKIKEYPPKCTFTNLSNEHCSRSQNKIENKSSTIGQTVAIVDLFALIMSAALLYTYYPTTYRLASYTNINPFSQDRFLFMAAQSIGQSAKKSPTSVSFTLAYLSWWWIIYHIITLCKWRIGNYDVMSLFKRIIRIQKDIQS